jgi:hypothetical protein
MSILSNITDMIFVLNDYKQNKLRGLSPQANYVDRATATSRRS